MLAGRGRGRVLLLDGLTDRGDPTPKQLLGDGELLGAKCRQRRVAVGRRDGGAAIASLAGRRPLGARASRLIVPRWTSGAPPRLVPTGPRWTSGASPRLVPTGPRWTSGASPRLVPTGPRWTSGAPRRSAPISLGSLVLAGP